MICTTLLAISYQLSDKPQTVDVALTPSIMTSKSTYRMSYCRARVTANTAQLRGYKLPAHVRATQSGIVYLAGKRTILYGVQDKKSTNLSEIGLDLDGNKVFDKSEVATLSGKSSSFDGGMTFSFRNNPNPVVFVTATGTESVSVSPARLMQGIAAFGEKTIKFTVGDANFDGKFGQGDMVNWAYRTVRSQSLSTLFMMPDGRYYTASLPSQELLRFTSDKRPTGLVFVKHGLIEASDIRMGGSRFDPIIKDGSIVLPEGSYILNVLAYSTTGTNGTPCHVAIWGSLKPYRVAGNKNLVLDPGPINRVGIRVRPSRKSIGLQLEAFTKGGYTVDDLSFRQGNSLSRPPAPAVEIVDPSGVTVAKVTLKYG